MVCYGFVLLPLGRWSLLPKGAGITLIRAALAGVILLGVLALIALRPRGLPVAWPAAVGALVVVLAGLLSLPELFVIFGATWDAALTLIALFVLSETLESNGFFRWAALHLARVARGSGWRLYGLILLLTTGVTALLANDGAVLMLTPILVVLLAKIYPDKRLHLPYIFACGFFADAMSGLLIPSNLTNIIVADAHHLSYARSAVWMALPTVAVFLVAGAAFALRFRRRLAVPFDAANVKEPESAIGDWGLFRLGWGVLAGLVIGYIVGGELGLPVSLIACSGALILLLAVHLRGLRSAHAILAAAPWSILIYAFGMFAVVTAAFTAGTLEPVARLLQAAAQPNGGVRGPAEAGSLLALLAAAANNLPATLVGVLALHGATQVGRTVLYAILLGVDIGPKLTPFGSLATLLWLRVLRRNGISISWGHYLRENWWVTLLALAAAFGGLALAHLLLA
jgi:arsenical pump membrane protein